MSLFQPSPGYNRLANLVFCLKAGELHHEPGPDHQANSGSFLGLSNDIFHVFFNTQGLIKPYHSHAAWFLSHLIEVETRAQKGKATVRGLNLSILQRCCRHWALLSLDLLRTRKFRTSRKGNVHILDKKNMVQGLLRVAAWEQRPGRGLGSLNLHFSSVSHLTSSRL